MWQLSTPVSFWEAVVATEVEVAATVAAASAAAASVEVAVASEVRKVNLFKDKSEHFLKNAFLTRMTNLFGISQIAGLIHCQITRLIAQIFNLFMVYLNQT